MTVKVSVSTVSGLPSVVSEYFVVAVSVAVVPTLASAGAVTVMEPSALAVAANPSVSAAIEVVASSPRSVPASGTRTVVVPRSSVASSQRGSYWADSGVTVTSTPKRECDPSWKSTRIWTLCLPTCSGAVGRATMRPFSTDTHSASLPTTVNVGFTGCSGSPAMPAESNSGSAALPSCPVAVVIGATARGT